MYDKECFDITVKYCFADNTAFELRERGKNVAVNMAAVRSVIDINIITLLDMNLT